MLVCRGIYAEPIVGILDTEVSNSAGNNKITLSAKLQPLMDTFRAPWLCGGL